MKLLQKSRTLLFARIGIAAASVLLSSCLLNDEGQLQRWEYDVSYSGSGPWTYVGWGTTAPTSIVTGDNSTMRVKPECTGHLFDNPRKFRHFPDFNEQNPASEIFRATNGNWDYLHLSSKQPDETVGQWQPLINSNVKAHAVRFGYFNGDCKTDVFTTWSTGWHVSMGGTDAWQNTSGSSVPVSKIRTGDFNGDRITDLFTTWGGNWYVSYGGNTTWNQVSGSDVDVSDVRMGDFDGDGVTDVFSTWGGDWYISYGGNSQWDKVSGSDVDVSDLRFGDFNGDGEADVFATFSGKWWVSWGATTQWNQINVSSYKVADLRFGDFNGDAVTDVLRITKY